MENIDYKKMINEVITDYTERCNTIDGKDKITTDEIMAGYSHDGVARLTLGELHRVVTQKGKLTAICFKEIKDKVYFGGIAYQKLYDSFISVFKTEQVINECLSHSDTYVYMKWGKGWQGQRQMEVEIREN